MSEPLSNIFNNDQNSSLDNGSPSGQSGGAQAQGGQNPAWGELLGELPQDLHQKVIPHLQRWDQGVNQRFQTVQQGYEPWKPIINAGVTPDVAQAGLNLINMLESNPQALYSALKEYYKFDEQQQQQQGVQGPGQGQNTEPTVEDPYQQKFSQMEQGYNTLAQHVLEMKQQEVNARADAALESEFQAAKQKYGDIFDEEWVQAKCIANPNLSVEQAAGMYHQWYTQQAAKFGAKPLIMGGGSNGLPNQHTDVTKLSDRDTRSLVANMLDQFNAQSR